MKIEVINTGIFKLDGGAMFGVVPKTLWSRSIPADDYNRIQMGLNVMLIEFDDRKILIDTGMGDKWDNKYKEIYAYDRSNLETALLQKNIKPEDITDVIVTHMHFDHIGGITKRDPQNHIDLTFPNALHHINKVQWNWARNATARDRASYLKENFEPLLDGANLNILDGPGELFPGVEVMIVNGHTPGQQIVIAHGKNIWAFLADLVPTHHHLPIPYVMGYDLEPLKTIEEKEKILNRAEKESWQLVFEHDYRVPVSKIKKGQKHYEIAKSEI